MRVLASVQKIESLRPIEGADKIEVARVLGWEVVVRRGEFSAGDLCVYHEIDSLLPDHSAYAFLRGGHKLTPGTAEWAAPVRLKTVKLRGQVSQGLALRPEALGLTAVDVGQDVSELLGITKWEPVSDEYNISMQPAGVFPVHLVPKTDETRVQAFPEVLNELHGFSAAATVKCDGTSATYILHRNGGSADFYVCSRNMQYKVGDNHLWRIALKYHIHEQLASTGRSLAVQGEICGPKWQRNRLGLSTEDMFVFNVYDVDTHKYMDHDAARDLCGQLGFKCVPEATRWESFDETVESLLIKAQGLYEGTRNPREGIVIRPLKERPSAALSGRLSFKVVSNVYLLRGGE